MNTPSVHCEARLRGISKKHDKGGDYAQITLQVQPGDLPDELWQAPLGSIFMVAFARIDDDGQAVEQETKKAKRPARPFASLARSQQAGILCNDETFQRWVVDRSGGTFVMNETCARQFVLGHCDINSRREIDKSSIAEASWDALLAQFERETGRATEARG